MTVESWVASCSAAFLLFIGYTANTSATDARIDPAKAQITILYDAFGQASAMQKDWGYAALVEYGGKRILFDTGNNPDILAQNAKAKDIDTLGLTCRKKVSASMARIWQAASIAKTRLSHLSSATTTVLRQKSCGLARLGRALIFNSSTRTRRSHLTSI